MMDSTVESKFESSRLARVAPITRVCGAAWGGFGLYYLCTGRGADGALCLVEAALSFLLAHVAKTHNCHRRKIAHFYVALIAIGLATECYLSGLAASYTQMFFACVVLIASFLLGPRWAWVWAVATICFVVVNDLVFPEFLTILASPAPLDKTLAFMTLISVVTGCAMFAEVTSDRYARKLESTSQELRERTLRLNQLVGIDTLTLLPNRHQFHEDTAAAIEHADDNDLAVCFCLIDLKNYKQLNERVGHAVGDEVLREVGARIRASVGADLRVYRIGGDEFVVAAGGLSREKEELQKGAMAIARSVKLGLRDGCELRERVFNIEANTGIAFYPNDAGSIDDVLLTLDAAVLEAKKKHDGIALYEPRMFEIAKRKERLDEQLTRAIQREEFTMFFQPRVNMRTNRIVGAEALLRWKQNGQFISPVWFIPQLEASGQILDLGRWILVEACQQARHWQLNDSRDFIISVNASPTQFQDERFYKDIGHALKSSGLAAESLDIEITETVFVDDSKSAVRNIKRLRDLGLSVSIDDFGTGYSSLRFLQGLPVNRLKIDRSFLKGIPDTDDGVIASSVIALGHSLGLTVVAEGIETENQLRYMRDHHCDEYQGYLFSRPLPPEEFGELLRSSASADEHSDRSMLR